MTRKIQILALSLVLLVFASACARKNGSADVVVKVAPATEKITQDEDISSLNEGTIYIAAAKGETEGAQFILKSDKDISAYQITVSDLKNGKQTITSDAVSVQTELYSYAPYSAKYSNSLPSGNYPDAVIPVNHIVDAKENKIEAKKNQGFFVDITVPEDATAGTYQGEIVAELDGQEIEIPLELTVYDFTIRSVPYTKSCYLIWQNWLHYGEWDSSDEKYMDYFDMMLDYNICGYTFPHTTASEFVSYVREYYDKVPCYGIPYDSLSQSQNDWDKYVGYMSELAEAALEDGVNYFDKAYYYWDLYYDEYTAFDWREEAMKTLFDDCDQYEDQIAVSVEKQGTSELHKAIAQSIRKVQHVIPGPAYDENFAKYDITTCPSGGAIDEAANLENYVSHSEGNDLWWYNCIGGEGGTIDYPHPDKTINGYLVSARDHFWSNYELGIIGDLYWNATGFCNWWAFDSSNSYMPLEDLYTTASHDSTSNGDGYILYPGLAYKSESPFASLRLVALRDGIDDHTYMSMLGELYQQISADYGANVSDAKSLVAFLNKNIVTRQTSKLDSNMLLDGRDALAKAIELANAYGVVIEELSVEENEIQYKIYTNADTELTVNGTAISSEVTGAGKCYSGSVSLTQERNLVLGFTNGGETQTLNMHTICAGEMKNDFETSDKLAACKFYTNYGSSVALNTNASYGIAGNSAEIILSGYDFGNSENNEQFKPKLGFEISNMGKKLSEIESIEFWVYNPQSEDIQVQLYFDGTDAESGSKLSFVYDEVILTANSWEKITIDNFKFISRNAEELDNYKEFGLRLSNQIGTTYKLYVDNLLVR